MYDLGRRSCCQVVLAAVKSTVSFPVVTTIKCAARQCFMCHGEDLRHCLKQSHAAVLYTLVLLEEHYSTVLRCRNDTRKADGIACLRSQAQKICSPKAGCSNSKGPSLCEQLTNRHIAVHKQLRSNMQRIARSSLHNCYKSSNS